MKKILFVVSGLAALAGGCATPEAGAPNEDVIDRVYTTGSNIPRKQKAGAADGVTGYDKETAERARDTQMQAPRPGLGKGGG